MSWGAAWPPRPGASLFFPLRLCRRFSRPVRFLLQKKACARCCRSDTRTDRKEQDPPKARVLFCELSSTSEWPSATSKAMHMAPFHVRRGGSVFRSGSQAGVGSSIMHAVSLVAIYTKTQQTMGQGHTGRAGNANATHDIVLPASLPSSKRAKPLLPGRLARQEVGSARLRAHM